MLDIESSYVFKHQSRVIILHVYLFDEIHPSTIPNHSFSISTLIKGLRKLVKNYQYRERKRFLCPFDETYTQPILPNSNYYTKYEESWSKNAQDRE